MKVFYPQIPIFVTMKTFYRLRILGVLYCFQLIQFVGIQSVSAQATPYHYTIQADLSTQLIYCLEQDEYGRLLIGTDKGLFRYNGYKSTRLSAIGQHAKEIVQLLRVKNNFLAINLSGQLFQLKGDKLTLIKLPNLKGDIRRISVDKNVLTVMGSKFISTYSVSSFKLISQESIPFTEVNETIANHVFTFKSKRFAVLNSGEFVEIDDGSARNLPSSTGKELITFNNQLVVIPSYTALDPVYTFQNGQFKSWNTLSPKGNVRVNGAKVIASDLIVFTENGLFVYKNGLSNRPLHWFKGISTTGVFEDNQHNVWVCTKGRGLLFIPAGKHDILVEGSILSVDTGPNNTLFCGNLDGTITQSDSRGRVLKTLSNNFSNQEALFVHYDKTDRLVFSNTGLFSLDNGKKINSVNETIKALARDKNGKLYMAKSSGVICIPTTKKAESLYGLLDSTLFRVLRKEPGRSVVVDPKSGRVAFSTVNGVYLLDVNQQVKEITFHKKHIDAQSIVWFKGDLIVATASNELLIIHGSKVIKERNLGASSRGDVLVLKLLANKTHVYLLSEKGMYRFEDTDKKIESLSELTGFDGLVMRDFVLINNQLYIATQRGILRFNWKEEVKNRYALVVKNPYGATEPKESISKKGTTLKFKSNEKSIIIPFECVDLSSNEQFIIRYAIQESNEKGIWNALPANSEQLNLSHLNPGDYTVSFYLYDPVSQFKSAIQSKQFSILPLWYESPLVYLIYFFIFLMGIGFAWRWTLRNERNKWNGAKTTKYTTV